MKSDKTGHDTSYKVTTMLSVHIRKYIDLHGSIKVTNPDGGQLTLSAHPEYSDSFIVEEQINCSEIYLDIESTGAVANTEYESNIGFYSFPEDVLNVIKEIARETAYATELRQLLPSAHAMMDYYKRARKTDRFQYVEYDYMDRDMAVYGISDVTFKQHHRSCIFVCPPSTIGSLSSDGNLIKGYMFDLDTRTVKFESIQAWRMRQLTRDELMEFDPKWGDIVK